MKNMIKKIGSNLIYRTGLFKLASFDTKILAFHTVNPKYFEKQIKHLVKYYNVISLSKIFSLEQLRAMSPFLNNTMLRWIIIIKPEHLSIKNNTEIEHSDMIRLKNVSTIEEAVLFMNENHITDEPIDLSFFP